MQFKHLVWFLNAGASLATEIDVNDGAPLSSCHSTVVPTAETSFGAGGLSRSAEVTRASSASSLFVSETTVCTQRCVVLTLATSTRQSLSSMSVIPDSLAISTSCSTIRGVTGDYSESPAPPTPSSTSIQISVASKSPSVSSCSSAEVIPSSSSSVSTSQSCSADITVTSTIVETWWSSAPLTTVLVRTRPVTITAALVEYSTSTGETLVPATRTTTATIHQISVDAACSQAKVCCASCGSIETLQPSREVSVSLGPSFTANGDPRGTKSVSAGQTGAPTAETTTGHPSVSAAGAAAAATAGIGLGALAGLLVVLV